MIRDVDCIERDLSNHIKLTPIIKRLIDMGFPIKDTIVSFKSINDNAFIYIGREPLSEDAFFSPSDLEMPNNRLTIRCRH